MWDTPYGNYRDFGKDDRLLPSERLSDENYRKICEEYNNLEKDLISELAKGYFDDVSEWTDYDWEDFEQVARGW